MRLNALGKHTLSLTLGIDVGAINHHTQAGFRTLMANYIKLSLRPLPVAREARQLKEKSAGGAIVRIGLNFADEFFDSLVKLARREQLFRLVHNSVLAVRP